MASNPENKIAYLIQDVDHKNQNDDEFPHSRVDE